MRFLRDVSIIIAAPVPRHGNAKYCLTSTGRRIIGKLFICKYRYDDEDNGSQSPSRPVQSHYANFVASAAGPAKSLLGYQVNDDMMTMHI